MSANTVGLLLSDDLIFTSRITATAQARNLPILVARTQQLLQALAQQQAPVCVLVDLDNPGLEIQELIRQLRIAAVSRFVVAYGSHVDAAGLRAAREAGCDLVLPRSKFVEDLPNQLPRWYDEANNPTAG